MKNVFLKTTLLTVCFFTACGQSEEEQPIKKVGLLPPTPEQLAWKEKQRNNIKHIDSCLYVTLWWEVENCTLKYCPMIYNGTLKNMEGFKGTIIFLDPFKDAIHETKFNSFKMNRFVKLYGDSYKKETGVAIVLGAYLYTPLTNSLCQEFTGYRITQVTAKFKPSEILFKDGTIMKR